MSNHNINSNKSSTLQGAINIPALKSNSMTCSATTTGLYAHKTKPGSQENSASVRKCREALCVESQAFMQPETIPILSILAAFLSPFQPFSVANKGKHFSKIQSAKLGGVLLFHENLGVCSPSAANTTWWRCQRIVYANAMSLNSLF